jgi:hypothetical protein
MESVTGLRGDIGFTELSLRELFCNLCITGRSRATQQWQQAQYPLNPLTGVGYAASTEYRELAGIVMLGLPVPVRNEAVLLPVL